MSTELTTERPTIDVNCDLGEERGDDAAVLPFVTSASVACGLHAGSPSTMLATVRAAAAAGVAVGAHPSFADREGFGRRELPMTAEAIFDLVLYQIGALDIFCRQVGVRMAHVKPHGALYHVGAQRTDAGLAIARAVHAARPDLILVGPPHSALSGAAARLGLRFAGELFVDRQYGPDGRLLPRAHPDALVTLDDGEAAERAVTMLREGRVPVADGGSIAQVGQTLCLHGDEPGVVGRARALRAALDRAQIRVAPLGAWL